MIQVVVSDIVGFHPPSTQSGYFERKQGKGHPKKKGGRRRLLCPQDRPWNAPSSQGVISEPVELKLRAVNWKHVMRAPSGEGSIELALEGKRFASSIALTELSLV